jgi:hypothetical protein
MLIFPQLLKGGIVATQRRRPDEPVGYTVEGILGMCGGKGAVARQCGVTVQAVANWGRRVPAMHARTVAIMAGLPLEIVRPDMVRSD